MLNFVQATWITMALEKRENKLHTSNNSWQKSKWQTCQLWEFDLLPMYPTPKIGDYRPILWTRLNQLLQPTLVFLIDIGTNLLHKSIFVLINSYKFRWASNLEENS